MKTSVIIVAAGRGIRAGSAVAKQFTPLGKSIVLMHTIDAFRADCNEIIVVIPEGGEKEWKTLCEEYNFTTDHKAVEGSSERFLSVRNGLAAVSEDTDIILVHDGVRPFVTSEVIARVIEGAKESGAVVPVIPIADSLRRVDGGIVSRSEVMAVQTPQGFNADILRKGYTQSYSKTFTDDASVVENLGVHVEMVEGDTRNFKITTPWDLEISQLIQ